VTIDDLSLLLAETRCEHGRLILEDATRAADTTGIADDWTAYLRDPAHPCPYEVRDFAAFQTHAPALPAAWLVLPPRAARLGRAYDDTSASLSLPDLARILADLSNPAARPDPLAPAAGSDTPTPALRLHALHRTGPIPPNTSASAGTGAAAEREATYLVELVDPATGTVRPAPSLAAYHQMRGCPDPALTRAAAV